MNERQTTSKKKKKGSDDGTSYSGRSVLRSAGVRACV
jgi:hypothetical protein